MGMFDSPVIKEIDGEKINIVYVGQEYGSPYYHRTVVVRRCRKEGKVCCECRKPIEKKEYYLKSYRVEYWGKFVYDERSYHLDCVKFVRRTQIYDKKGNLIYEFIPKEGEQNHEGN